MSRLPAAVLLDQDGTLVDSEGVWEEVEVGLASELGGTLSPEVRATLIGGPMSLTVRAMQDLASREVDADWLESTIISRVTERLRSRPIPWFADVAPFLARVREAGVPVALVTSSFRCIVDAVAADVPGGPFDAVVAGDEVARSKPAPDGYLRAAELLGVDVRDCVAVEDSPNGLAAARASGAHCVHLLRPAAAASGVAPCDAPEVHVVDSLDALDAAVLTHLAGGGVR